MKLQVIFGLALVLSISGCTSDSNDSNDISTDPVSVSGSLGDLRVNISLIGSVANSVDSVDNLQKAVDIWVEVFQRADLGLNVAWYNFSGPDQIPDPQSNDPFYSSIVNNTRPNSFNLVIAQQVEGLNTSDDKYGINANTPDSTDAEQSVAAIAILKVTGSDGRFNYYGDGATIEHNDEVRLAAEEMAHLAGHYLGLQNSVELQGNNVIGTDNLNDTPSCIALTDCRLGDAKFNFMFPKPAKKFTDNENGENSNEYFPRDDVSNEQGLAMQHGLQLLQP